ncbi:hypothetical protein [Phytohabitans aurantiacus]|jgi:hypothetical protein|nr:hypothetical protein [Phytohabitans aurantiacus]
MTAILPGPGNPSNDAIPGAPNTGITELAWYRYPVGHLPTTESVR